MAASRTNEAVAAMGVPSWSRAGWESIRDELPGAVRETPHCCWGSGGEAKTAKPVVRRLRSPQAGSVPKSLITP